MQNRILRLDTRELILQRLTEFVNKKINIVRTDNTVQLVELLKISGEKLFVRNMRRQELTVAVADIYEILIDQHT